MDNPFAKCSAADRLPPAAFVDDLQTPALLVDLDRVRDNVRRVIERCGGVDRWRPHLKTTKIREVWVELLRAGVRQFKCATTREAQVFCEVAAGERVAADLLVAYPHRGPGLRRLGEIAGEAARVRMSVLVEDPAVLADLSPALGVFVDVNPGMNRTGVPIAAVDEIVAIASRAGARFRGVHFYDGHLHAADLEERREQIHSGYRQLLQVVARLAEAGAAVGEVVTAGTPAFAHALTFDGFDGGAFVHRVSPGTVVFHDGRTEVENPDVDLAPAALVLARVVSHPDATIATCDAGSKSVAAEGADGPCAFVLGSDSLTAMTPSEEHLPLRCDGSPLPPRGETLLLVPWHVCPTVNLADRAVLLEQGHAPRIVEVAARAHEV